MATVREILNSGDVCSLLGLIAILAFIGQKMTQHHDYVWGWRLPAEASLGCCVDGGLAPQPAQIRQWLEIVLRGLLAANLALGLSRISLTELGLTQQRILESLSLLARSRHFVGPFHVQHHFPVNCPDTPFLITHHFRDLRMHQIGIRHAERALECASRVAHYRIDLKPVTPLPPRTLLTASHRRFRFNSPPTTPAQTGSKQLIQSAQTLSHLAQLFVPNCDNGPKCPWHGRFYNDGRKVRATFLDFQHHAILVDLAQHAPTALGGHHARREVQAFLESDAFHHAGLSRASSEAPIQNRLPTAQIVLQP